MNEVPHRSDRFPETRWGLILRIAGTDPDDRNRALEEICELYRPPIYSFIRNLGHSPHDSDDLTQEFFANFLKKDCFSRPVAERGKLRTFLLTAVKRFLTDEHRKGMRQKRGGGAALVSIEAADEKGGIPLDMLPDERSPRRFLIVNGLRLSSRKCCCGSRPTIATAARGRSTSCSAPTCELTTTLRPESSSPAFPRALCVSVSTASAPAIDCCCRRKWRPR